MHSVPSPAAEYRNDLDLAGLDGLACLESGKQAQLGRPALLPEVLATAPLHLQSRSSIADLHTLDWLGWTCRSNCGDLATGPRQPFNTEAPYVTQKNNLMNLKIR